MLSVSNASSHVSEMLQVTTGPFGTNVVIATNGGILSTYSAPWSAMSFNAAGTLYGATLGGSLAAINPGTAASTFLADLHQAGASTLPEILVSAEGLAVSRDGQAYVSDGVSLYSVDLGGGSCSNLGSFSQPGAALSPLILSLAEAPNGTMFGGFLNLYKVNLANAQVTQVGPSFPFGSVTSAVTALGAAFGSDGNLYIVGSDDSATNHPKLYQVNTNNGAATPLGTLPFGSRALVALNPPAAGAPVIIVPPSSQTSLAGGSVTFSVVGTGSPSPQVQWFFGSGGFLAATNLTLTITNVSPTNAGSYFVVLSNDFGTATSAVFALSVTAPILASSGTTGALTNSILGLTTNPPTETALLRSNLTISCLAFGPGGSLFGLGSNRVNVGASGLGVIPAYMNVQSLYVIDTATQSAQLIGSFQTGNSLSATNLPGLAFSPSGVLYAALAGKLYTLDTNTAQPTLVGVFPSNAIIQGIAFAPAGTLYGGETNLYTINPANASVSKIATLNGAGASILGDMKYGADGFLYFFDGGTDGNLYRLNPANAQVSVVANYPSTLSGLAFVPIPTVLVTQPVSQTVTNGGTAAFSVTATGTAPLRYQWYFNRAAVSGATNAVFAITNTLARNNGTYEVTVGNSLGAVTSSVVTLTTFTPPLITRPPAAQVITPGQTIALSVVATGTPLGYQWQFDGTNLPGRTAASLTIRDADTANAGTYTIVVSSPYAPPVSASASAAVIPLAPVIATPVNNSVGGASAVTVSGREPANGGAEAIVYQLNGGPMRLAGVSGSGLAWTAPVQLLPGTNVFLILATNRSGSSSSVQARYIYNPFIPVAGVYSGLFSDTNSPAFTNSGYFNLTLGSDATFSGAILLDGARVSLAGRFDTNGVATLLASNAPVRVYAVTLQLDLSGVAPLTGSISNVAQSWNGSVRAVRAAFGRALPATNYAGNYSLAITGPDSANSPPGSSYAMITVGSDGSVVLNGRLADGTPLTSDGAAISQAGEWPLYSSLFAGKGSVLSWINFPAHTAPGATASAAMWFETAASGPYYTNGFNLLTNQLAVQLDCYLPPSRGIAVLPGINYSIQIFGGGLSAGLSNNLAINSNNSVAVTGSNTNGLSITLNPAAGSFTGRFTNSALRGPVPFNGILLPDSDTGLGYFLGTNQAGAIIIQPQ